MDPLIEQYGQPSGIGQTDQTHLQTIIDSVRLAHDRPHLASESEGNLTIQVTQTGEEFAFLEISRGELRRAVLIETMRREGL